MSVRVPQQHQWNHYQQIKALLGRSPIEGAIPVFVFDAGYDPVKLQQGIEGSACQILVRLRAGRCFYADPSLAERPANPGRPRRHGPKMKCGDPGTWPEPSMERECEDTGYGAARVRAWAGMHPKIRAHERRGSRGPLPIVLGTLILVEVERLPRGERRREPKQLWLWWHGPEGTAPELDLLWRAYVRRFDPEHAFRFLKQTLGWGAPRMRHPEQADRWTWLILVAYTQLRLARGCRGCVADRRLPWERRYETGRPTPIRASPRPFDAFGAPGYARQAAETLRQVSRAAQRAPLGSGRTLSGHQEERLNTLKTSPSDLL
jgi:hypothetical protein